VNKIIIPNYYDIFVIKEKPKVFIGRVHVFSMSAGSHYLLSSIDPIHSIIFSYARIFDAN
jgi:hypothetical protein